MKEVLFTGACTALVTPFIGEQINYPMMEKLLLRQQENGIKSVVVCGTTGESPTLSDQEKLELFRHCKACAGSDMQIICGTGSNNTAHAVELSIAAQEAGADALLVVSPYYNKANPEGLYLHYISIANAVNIPVIIYNVPGRTGVDIPVTVYKELSKVPNIAGVKEASTDIVKIAKIRNACGDDLPIWSGNDDQAVAAMALGAKGVISVLSNVCPKETAILAQAALKEDYKTASRLQCQMLPLIEALFAEVNPIPVKAAMKLIGFDCGPCRLPLGPISQQVKQRLENLLK